MIKIRVGRLSQIWCLSIEVNFVSLNHYFLKVTNLILSILPESFHFLAERSKVKSLKKWLRRADKNSFEVSFLSRVLVDKPTRQTFGHFFQFMWNNKKYIIYLILSALISWDFQEQIFTSQRKRFRAINFFVYFGMSSYSIHQNYILSGLVELPAYLIAPFLLNG